MLFVERLVLLEPELGARGLGVRDGLDEQSGQDHGGGVRVEDEAGADRGGEDGVGVLGPEALPPRPFLDLLTEYGSPWAREERTPASS